MRSSLPRSLRLTASSITTLGSCPSTDFSEYQSGTPVYVAEDFVAADLHITLGFIEPHLMAGFSGARKLVAPGLGSAGNDQGTASPKFMRDPKPWKGPLTEILSIANCSRSRDGGHHFMVDVALTRDRKIAAVFAGEPVQAHAAGMKFVSRVMLKNCRIPSMP